MFYEEKLIDGRLYCRGTPDGEWRLVTIDALTRRVLAAEADLERAMENHAADLSAAPEARALDEEWNAALDAAIEAVENMTDDQRDEVGAAPYIRGLRRITMNNGEVSR